MMKSNTLLISGSRSLEFVTLETLFNIFDQLSYSINRPFDTIVHGGARGVDYAGGLWAEGKNKQVKVMPADWEQWGKRAGYLRNAEMSYLVDAAIIVWDGISKGAKNMLDICIERELPTAVRIIGADEE